MQKIRPKGRERIALTAITAVSIGQEIQALEAVGAALHSIVLAPFEASVSRQVGLSLIARRLAMPQR